MAQVFHRPTRRHSYPLSSSMAVSIAATPAAVDGRGQDRPQALQEGAAFVDELATPPRG